MKKLCFASIAIAGSVLFYACNGSSTKSSMNDTTTTTMSSDTGSGMKNMATDTTSTMVDEDTRDFAKEAATGGMMEVSLGNIAMKNAASQSVKDFGKMMVDDHTKLNDNLKDLASKKNITLPGAVTEDQQKDIDKLGKKTGKDFDKDYVSMMIDDHKKDINAFKKAGDKLSDPDFKTFIINSLPTLQKHLDSVQNIKKKM